MNYYLNIEEKRICSNFYLEGGDYATHNYKNWLKQLLPTIGRVYSREEYGAPLNIMWENQTTLLYYILAHGFNMSVPKIQQLQNFNSDFNLLDGEGNSVVHIAAARANILLINKIVAVFRINPLPINFEGDSYHTIMMRNFPLTKPPLFHEKEYQVFAATYSGFFKIMENFILDKMNTILPGYRVEEFISNAQKIYEHIQSHRENMPYLKFLGKNMEQEFLSLKLDCALRVSSLNKTRKI